eukprot:1933951-Alexandrium_andersonii.AAC.1
MRLRRRGRRRQAAARLVGEAPGPQLGRCSLHLLHREPDALRGRRPEARLKAVYTALSPQIFRDRHGCQAAAPAQCNTKSLGPTGRTDGECKNGPTGKTHHGCTLPNNSGRPCCSA